MCTAISFNSHKHYFGRNLDFEHSFGEEIVITSRRFPLYFRHTDPLLNHYALIGMAAVSENFPLYFDATNEKGLSGAGLLFSGYAQYHEIKPAKTNLAPFELILWFLAQCKSVAEVKELVKEVNITDTNFSTRYPNTPLHWIFSDKESSIVIESVSCGLYAYDNPAGILTNSPEFPAHLLRLNDYMQLSPSSPKNTFAPKLDLKTYSRGMGALGLPGDFSSMSRFIRASFLKTNATSDSLGDRDSLNIFFHILKNVSPCYGSVLTDEGDTDVTLYSSCVDTEKGIYYYTTFEGNQVHAVDIRSQQLDSDLLYTFPLDKTFSSILQSTPSATFSYNLLH